VKKKITDERSAPPDGESLSDFVDAAARTLALPLEPAWKPAIEQNVRVTLQHAALVAEFPLADEAEPAPTYKV
jgi:hypothetical protein